MTSSWSLNPNNRLNFERRNFYFFQGKNIVQQEYKLVMYNILFMHGLSKFFGSVEFVLVVRKHGRKIQAFDVSDNAFQRHRREVENY